MASPVLGPFQFVTESVQWLHVRCPCQELGPYLGWPFSASTWSPNTLRPDWACPFLFLELSIQPSLNAILIPPHLRSPAGTATLTPSSQGKSEALFADEGLPQPGRLVCCHSPRVPCMGMGIVDV